MLSNSHGFGWGSRCDACMTTLLGDLQGLLECATAGNAPADREETGTAFLKPY